MVFANIFLITCANARMLDAHSFKFDSKVVALFDFAQSHPDVVQLSDEFIALYHQFQDHNCELSVAEYMKFRLEAHAYNQLIAQSVNAETMSQEFIDLHS